MIFLLSFSGYNVLLSSFRFQISFILIGFPHGCLFHLIWSDLFYFFRFFLNIKAIFITWLFAWITKKNWLMHPQIICFWMFCNICETILSQKYFFQFSFLTSLYRFDWKERITKNIEKKFEKFYNNHVKYLVNSLFL